MVDYLEKSFAINDVDTVDQYFRNQDGTFLVKGYANWNWNDEYVPR